MTNVALKKLRITYRKNTSLLNDVTVKFEPNSLNWVVGKSGSGKTSLLRVVSGLQPPSRGKVSVDDQELIKLNHHQLAQYRRRIGMIDQNPAFIPKVSVFDNIALLCRLNGFSRTETRKLTKQSIEQLGLGGVTHMLPAQLSRSDQQLVCIARAIVHTPPLIIADEPMAVLDTTLTEDVQKLFLSLIESETTFIVTTTDTSVINDAKDVFFIADRTLKPMTWSSSESQGIFKTDV